LHKVCGYDCYSTGSNPYGMFIYTVVNDVASSKNYVNYSSIGRCVGVNSDSCSTLCLGRGKICCPSVNSSMNKCYSRSIYYYPYSDSNSVTCSLTYSSFTDNINTGYNCIYLSTSSAKYEIKSCNILRNTQGSLDTDGTIRANGNLVIEDSCILENRATRNFHQTSSYTTLSKCTVDSTSNNGYLTIQNTVTKNFILALNHMSTKNCHSEYDSVGTLNPIIQSPTSSKKQKLYFTFGNFFCQYQLRYLVTLISLLLFNFIHLEASI
jgi:hypothetical protein